jgi:hypothetical protein
MLALNRIQPRRKSNPESFHEQTFKAKQNSSSLRHKASRPESWLATPSSRFRFWREESAV